MSREVRYAKSGDAHIAYQVVGDGPIDVVLVMEGFIPIDTMDDEPHIARCMRRLGSFSRLIRFDRRGIGLSDPCAPSAPPTLEQWVEDVLAVMDAVGSERAAVLGAGEAALVPLLLGAMHPERVSAVVVMNAFSCAIRAPDYPFGFTSEELDEWLDGVVDSSPDSDPSELLREVAPSVADDPSFRLWWQQTGQRGASPATARALLGVALRCDIRDALPTIRVPTLVMHARDNATTPLFAGRYIAEHVPGARFVEIPGADDFWWVGNSAAVLDEIEEFLTGSRGLAEPDRVLATVLFGDIVSSTDAAVAAGDRGWRDVLDRYDALVRRQVERFGGRVVKTTGDGVLAVFDGPARAIRAGHALRDVARQVGVESRVGLHAGEIELRGDDVAGLAVHIAARIGSAAGPGEVLVSSTVRDLVAGSGIDFVDRGMQSLRGVPEPWRLFAADG